MLRILREHATSWMLRGLLVLVAVTFISWGGYSLIREKDVDYAARVNGEDIGLKEFTDAYQGAVKQYRDALGASFSEKMLDELKLKENIMEDLIGRVLILQEAKRLGLAVGDTELRESIEAVPAFQVNGQFDQRTYERALQWNLRATPEQFEQSQRTRLMMTKLVNVIRLNGGRISDDEVLEVYRFENERVNLSFIKVAPGSFRGQVSVNEVEEKDYYQSHLEEFRIPTLVQVQYLTFRPSDFEGKAQVTPDELKRAYDLQKDRLKTPKRVKAREILVRVAPGDPADKIEEKKKKAEEILEKTRKTKDFAALARQYSESPTASKGGDLGWVQQGTLEAPLQNGLMSLKAGEVSGLVKATAGFYILRADEVTEEKQRSLDEVKDQLLPLLRREKGKQEASRRAEDAFYTLFRSRDLENYAKEKGLPVNTTGFFKEGDELPGFGKDPTFQSAAFALRKGEMSAVVAVPPNYYLLKLVEKKESRIPSFEEAREEVRKKMLAMKADEKARQVAEDLLKQIQSGKPMKEAAQERGLPVEETGLFLRSAGVIPKIGPAGEFGGEIASLTEKNPVPKDVLKTPEGYFEVKLIAREPADESKFPSAKQDLERRLAYQKQEQFFKHWLDQLRQNAKIEVNKNIEKS
jgi:peptidyl-prolyl cis-trans isomerase D